MTLLWCIIYHWLVYNTPNQQKKRFVKIMIFERNIRFKLEKALSFSPVVLLTGARQTGKTTLAKEFVRTKGYSYITFDSADVLDTAKKDPVGFINNLPKPAIIDEVQRFPELFLAIKEDVDTNRIPGRYILTGSANPLLIPRLGDSLAGRMVILSMYPFSQGELKAVTDRFIDWAFSDDKPLLQEKKTITKTELYSLIFKGGYPSAQNLDEIESRVWFDSYVTSILYRDVHDLTNIAGLLEFPRLLRVLATRVGNLLNIADIARSTDTPPTTLHRYFSLLQILFITLLVQPWFMNLGKRLVKTPKVYLLDSGLLTYLLGMNFERATLDATLMGGLVENFVITELLKQASWSTAQVNFFHYRTVAGSEVDIIIENFDGRIIGIEVKSAEIVHHNDLKGLKNLQEEIGQRFFRGIVLYAGNKVIPYGNNLYAMPISSLWTQV